MDGIQINMVERTMKTLQEQIDDIKEQITEIVVNSDTVYISNSGQMKYLEGRIFDVEKKLEKLEEKYTDISNELKFFNVGSFANRIEIIEKQIENNLYTDAHIQRIEKLEKDREWIDEFETIQENFLERLDKVEHETGMKLTERFEKLVYRINQSHTWIKSIWAKIGEKAVNDSESGKDSRMGFDSPETVIGEVQSKKGDIPRTSESVIVDINTSQEELQNEADWFEINKERNSESEKVCNYCKQWLNNGGDCDFPLVFKKDIGKFSCSDGIWLESQNSESCQHEFGQPPNNFWEEFFSDLLGKEVEMLLTNPKYKQNSESERIYSDKTDEGLHFAPEHSVSGILYTESICPHTNKPCFEESKNLTENANKIRDLEKENEELKISINRKNAVIEEGVKMNEELKGIIEKAIQFMKENHYIISGHDSKLLKILEGK